MDAHVGALVAGLFCHLARFAFRRRITMPTMRGVNTRARCLCRVTATAMLSSCCRRRCCCGAHLRSWWILATLRGRGCQRTAPLGACGVPRLCVCSRLGVLFFGIAKSSRGKRRRRSGEHRGLLIFSAILIVRPYAYLRHDWLKTFLFTNL